MYGFLINLHSRLVTFGGELTERLREESGQGMVEYGLILALVSIAAILALTAIGTDVKKVFEEIGKSL